MKEALTTAELVDYLDFNPEVGGSDVTLLGLKAEQLHQHDAHKMVNSIVLTTLAFFIGGGDRPPLDCL